MAGWILALVIAASAHVFQKTTAEPNVQETSYKSIHHDKHSVWSCEENACSLDDKHNSNQIKGHAELLIEDLHIKLREAELELANPHDYPPHYDLTNWEEFDFIVIGAGSAGAVVASRLSEVKKWRVLLVEAGGDPPKTSEFPSLSATLQDTDIDWQYKTDDGENNCLGMVGNQCKWPRGKVLGGSSVINYMMYTRGHPRDFDNWEQAGNKGWSYEDVLPYFKKSEDMRDSVVLAMEGAETYHSTGGYLSLEPWPHDMVKESINPFAEGLEDLGYNYIPDFNGKNQTGFTKMPGTTRDYRRCSTAKAFLSPAKERKNLFVSKHSLAAKILINNEKRAYGIHLITKEGKNIEVRAKKEIIVSAGAINSPQLLMLSGIGPNQHLRDLGIPVIVHLPVGENLQDHPLMSTFVVTINSSVSFTPPTYEDTFNFLLKNPSRLSSLCSFPYAAYINTISGVDYPDMEILQNHISKNNKLAMISLLSSFNLKKEVMEEFIEINQKAYTIQMFGSLMRPYSRGRILLQSNDPNTYPRIIAGTLSDKRDVDTYLRTYDFVTRLVNTDALKRVDAKFHEIRLRDCEKHPFSSPEYRECAMRHLTATTYHYSGTCKMGPAADASAVVDPSLKVRGIERLRVADASVMPTIVSAHINAAVIMIGEKAADMIIKEWNNV